MIWLALTLAPILATDKYEDAVKTLTQLIQKPDHKHSAFQRLAYIVDNYGPRLWGSAQLEMVIEVMREMAQKEGFDDVRLEPVTNFTRWIRHSESLQMTSPRKTALDLTALGYSVSGEVEAEVVVLHKLSDLADRKDQVAGKIVVFNYNWTSYYASLQIRIKGPSQCARYGAKAMLLRSIASRSISSVHTGYTIYDQGYPKIPAAAITIEDAAMIERMVDRKQKVVVSLNISTAFQDNCNSSNLVFEIKGDSQPEKILLMGGHIDSWDTGSQTGANDDGGGFITVFEALRLIKGAGLKPRRTLRFVAWSGEESGQPNKGAFQYAQRHKQEADKHVVAFESDLGSTQLRGFGLSGKGLPVLTDIANKYLTAINASDVSDNGQAVDTTPMHELGVPMMKNLIKDTENHDYYFSFHHSAGDSMTMMDPDQMDSNVLGIASVMYILGDIDKSLR